MPKPRFFSTPADWRGWLDENHASADELWVGFYKRDSGRPSITWPEAVDGALCFGWIDGVRHAGREGFRSWQEMPRVPKGRKVSALSQTAYPTFAKAARSGAPGAPPPPPYTNYLQLI